MLDAAESLERTFGSRRATAWRRSRATGPASTASGSTSRWRICFVWADAGPQDVEIVDYH